MRGWRQRQELAEAKRRLRELAEARSKSMTPEELVLWLKRESDFCDLAEGTGKHGYGFCSASTESIANEAGITTDKAYRLLKAAERQGIITRRDTRLGLSGGMTGPGQKRVGWAVWDVDLTRDDLEYRQGSMRQNPANDLEWIKGDGVDRDGHNLTWWKNKLKRWKSEYNRPRAYIRVTCWDRQGQQAQHPEYSLDDLARAKKFAKEWAASSGSARVDARIEVPYDRTYVIEIGEYRSSGSDGFYVWSVDRDGVPYDRRGPWESMDEAIGHAKVSARAGNKFDFIVTFGSDPEASDFEIVKAFKAWSGEVHFGTDLPRVGRRLGEYR